MPSSINIPAQPYSRADARSFIARLSGSGVLEHPVMAHAARGDFLLLRNGAALKIHAIRKDQSKGYPAFMVRFEGLVSIEIEYDDHGLSMDSEYADEKPAPFDVIALERHEIADLSGG